MTWSSCYFFSPCNYTVEIVFSLHDLIFLFLSTVLVAVLLGLSYFFFSFEFSFNFFESHPLENVWTIVPFLILLLIAVPSLNSLYLLDNCNYCGTTFGVTGHQWYWSYSNLQRSEDFDRYISSEDGFIRLIEVDNRLVVPSEVPIRFLVSSADVLHSWALPSFGLKVDAIPGRIRQFCSSSYRSGVFFGQCSEICGANHRFIPIVLEVAPWDAYFKIFS